jgi:AAA domain
MSGREFGRKTDNNGKAADQTKPKPPILARAKTFVSGYKPPEYLIDGLLQRGRLYATTALTGHGKTAVCLALNVQLATGRALNGSRVSQGNALYFAAENPDDAKARMILMADRLSLDLETLPMWFVEGSFNLDNWTDHIRSEVEKIGGVQSITVDTGPAFLAACGFADENDNLQALKFALQLRQLTKLPGNPVVLVPTHPIKIASKENLLPRGGSAFLNELDGNLTLWAEGDRSTTELSWAGKLRGPAFDPITFALETGTCAGLTDVAGRSVPSVWAYQIDEQRAEQVAKHHREDEDAVLVAMANYPKASFADLAKTLGWFTKTNDPAKYRVQRSIKRLHDARLVSKNRRDEWTLTTAGKKEAKRLEDDLRNQAA